VLIEIVPPTSIVVPMFAKYLLSTMILLVFSVFISVVTLNFHYRTGTSHRMPVFIRKVFLVVHSTQSPCSTLFINCVQVYMSKKLGMQAPVVNVVETPSAQPPLSRDESQQPLLASADTVKVQDKTHSPKSGPSTEKQMVCIFVRAYSWNNSQMSTSVPPDYYTTWTFASQPAYVHHRPIESAQPVMSSSWSQNTDHGVPVHTRAHASQAVPDNCCVCTTRVSIVTRPTCVHCAHTRQSFRAHSPMCAL
jgi:hypothetical protein